MQATLLFQRAVETFFTKEIIQQFEDKLWVNESKSKTITEFLEKSIFQATILMVLTMIFSFFYLNLSPEKSILLGVCGFFIPFGINYIYVDLVFEKRKREKESMLADLLLQASIFCDESSLLETLNKIASQDFGLISRDLTRTLGEIKKGASIEEALCHIKETNKSNYYSRVIDLFLQGYKSGNDISSTLKETAEDILESQAIIKERQAVMLVTKYTLIFSSAFIVPGILGLIIGLVSGLNFSGISNISFGMNPQERENLFLMSKLGASIYVVEYALLSSYFLALQDSNKKQVFIYAPLIGICAIIVFLLAQIL